MALQPTHEHGRRPEEVGAVLPMHSLLLYELEIQLVHEGRGLKRGSTGFPIEV
jgi:hypothetical protein